MRLLVTLLVLGAAACGQQPEPKEVVVAPAPADLALAPPVAPRKSMLVPMPDDKAALQRLEAMGYTVHDDHLHLPGVKTCPMDMSGGPVQ